MKSVFVALSLVSLLVGTDAAPHRCQRPSSSVTPTVTPTAISQIIVPSSSVVSSLLPSSVISSSSATPTSVPATPKPTTSSTIVPSPSSSKPAPPASSSSSVAVPAPSNKPSSVLKKGLAYNAASATVPFGSKAGWAYNWDSAPNGAIGANQQFIPMLWGTASDHVNAWKANAEKAIANGATHLLGFNEPDLGSQSNIAPDVAAKAWKEHIQPFAGKAKLVSPAVTNGGSPLGLTYLDKFLAACTGCQVDAIAIHIYDSATNIKYFQNYISDVAKKYGKPVWVTEFAGSGTAAQQRDFMNTMVDWLEAQPFIERYAYFGDLEGVMINNGKLTDLGSTYLSA